MHLDKWRVAGDLVESFSIMVIMICMNNYYLKCDDCTRRGNGNKLFKRRCWLVTRKFVFGNRIVATWNGLLDSCINCTALNDFKSQIRLELEPEMQSYVNYDLG